jgi:hypothetical protein
MIRPSLATHTSNLCDNFNPGLFGKCKSCGKQKRAHQQTKISQEGSRVSSAIKEEEITKPEPEIRRKSSFMGLASQLPGKIFSRKKSFEAASKDAGTGSQPSPKAVAIASMKGVGVAQAGFLSKQSSGISGLLRDFQERYFVLRSNFLMYYNAKPEDLDQEPKGVYNINGAVCLATDTKEHYFEVHFPNTEGETVLYLRGRSAQNALLWIEAINKHNMIDETVKERTRASTTVSGAETAQIQPISSPRKKSANFELPVGHKEKSSGRQESMCLLNQYFFYKN